MPLKLILDSNFLYIPIEFRLDLLEELERVTERKIEPIVLSPVYAEIKAASAKKGKLGKLAAAALEYAEKLKLVDIEAKLGETVDDIILRFAMEWNCPVATNDRILRKRLRDINVTVIYLRQRSHLEIKGQV